MLKYDEDGKLISVNLDIKNPRGPADLEHLPPEQLVEGILSKEQRIMEMISEVKQLIIAR